MFLSTMRFFQKVPENNSVVSTGLYPDFLGVMQERLNFSLWVRTTPLPKWNDMVDQVYAGEFEMAVTGFSQTYERFLKVDFSLAFVSSTIRLFYKVLIIIQSTLSCHPYVSMVERPRCFLAAAVRGSLPDAHLVRNHWRRLWSGLGLLRLVLSLGQVVSRGRGLLRQHQSVRDLRLALLPGQEVSLRAQGRCHQDGFRGGLAHRISSHNSIQVSKCFEILYYVNVKCSRASDRCCPRRWRSKSTALPSQTWRI